MDDEPYNIMIFKLFLRNEEEFLIDSAYNGKEAIEKLIEGA